MVLTARIGHRPAAPVALWEALAASLAGQGAASVVRRAECRFLAIDAWTGCQPRPSRHAPPACCVPAGGRKELLAAPVSFPAMPSKPTKPGLRGAFLWVTSWLVKAAIMARVQ